MTSEQWEKAPEVDAVEAAHRPTDPAPAPAAFDDITEVSCIICGVKDGEHDAACPRQKSIAP